MKRLSLQWRITLMSVLLIGITCVAMNLLLCSSGVYYMDTIADSLQGGGTVILNDGGAASFDPQLIAPNEELTIVVDGVQGRFRTTNWYITAAVTLLSGILAYFVSGRALKPLRSFASQVEQVHQDHCGVLSAHAARRHLAARSLHFLACRALPGIFLTQSINLTEIQRPSKRTAKSCGYTAIIKRKIDSI